MRIKVLDHGYVELVDCLPRDTYTDSGIGAGDLRVVEAARVSYAGEAYVDPEMNQKLIKYLFDNKHTSPFEHVRFTWLVKLPIFVARQWIRHRTGSFNETSMRYKEATGDYYLPDVDRMLTQSTDNKQCSAPTRILGAEGWRSVMRNIMGESLETYKALLTVGLARETARMVLPLSMYTEWYWTTDLHNFMHFLRLRLHPHAQYEIRQYAKALLESVRHIAPYTLSLIAPEQHPCDLELRLLSAEETCAKCLCTAEDHPNWTTT